MRLTHSPRRARAVSTAAAARLRRNSGASSVITPAVPLPRLGSGTYILVLRLEREREVHIGRLGRFPLPSGFYLYAGSALGPGGLAGRLGHHLRAAPSPRWHIDYVRAVTSLDQIWLLEAPERREHAWAAALGKMRGASRPVVGFGSSDCRCATHLFHFQRRPSLRGFGNRAGDRLHRLTLDPGLAPRPGAPAAGAR